jgi:protein-S-isoprenylcysteine O-methyltransferase Ste14
MYVVLGILAFLALGCVLFIFLSNKSSRHEKLAALGALILNGLVLGICGVLLIFVGTSVEEDPYAFPLDPPPPEPERMSSGMQLLIWVIILMLFFGAIVFLWFREQKKLAQTGKNKTQGTGFR